MEPITNDHRFLEFPFADYLLVFISFIVGYVVTEFFAGWGSLIRNRERVQMYWLHLVWTICFFFQLMENWWWLWGNRMKIAENVFYFFFTLVSPLIFYLITVFLFPSIPAKGTFSFRTHYYKTFPYTFLMLILLMASYFVNNVWIKELPLWALDNLFCYAGIVWGSTLMLIKSERYHALGFAVGTTVFAAYVWLNAQG